MVRMWIGVFDSGLGGLAVAAAIAKRLPQYDFLYLGDTKRVPYGARSQETIHEFVSKALNFLFAHGCQLVVLACNTASAEALRKSQRDYLPRHYPERRVLGVVIPASEAVFEQSAASLVGVLATNSTVESGAYLRELERQRPGIEVVQQAAPLLVPLIENDGMKYLGPVLDDYLAPLQEANVDCIVLGCTHYCLIKQQVRARTKALVVSQDEVVPGKLADYLARHPEIEVPLHKGGLRRYCVTDLTPSYSRMANVLIGAPIELEKVSLA
jgi:glutamate racemase